MYCKKIQLEILNEIAQKSDGKNIIDIDCTDPKRKHNYQILDKAKCFLYFSKPYKHEPSDGFYFTTRRSRIGLKGLTDYGHEFRYNLGMELKKEQWEEEQVMRDRRRFCYDTVAVFVSVIALILSVIALVV